ncbi:MAG: hypothetical protein JXQ90_21420 [Cyclobacteriaceae bacterium]
MSKIIFEHSPWWLLVCILLSLGIAYLSYSKKDPPWTTPQNWLLATLRFVGIMLIALLILNPMTNLIRNETISPKIAIIHDNSTSTLQTADSLILRSISTDLKEAVSGLGYSNELFSLSSNITDEDSLIFDEYQTNIHGALSNPIEQLREKNLGAIVLISDGIYNRGATPALKNYPFPVFTIGLGDTIPPKDLSIMKVSANKIAYQNNKFPIVVEIDGRSYLDESTTVQLMNRGRVIDQKNLVLKRYNEVEFLVDADEAGLQNYVIEVAPMDAEATLINNRQSTYVDIVEGKENILIVSPGPHPDIRAIRMALEASHNYEVTLHIPSMKEADLSKSYDVVIVHGAFASNTSIPNIKGKPNMFYILNDKSNINQLPQFGINIQNGNAKADVVKPAYNVDFSKFQLTAENLNVFRDYPPLNVPFGEYSGRGPIDHLLFQQIGSINTGRPLLSYYDDGTKRASILLGSGIWQWRILENALHESSDNFDELITKTIQYLSVKSDKRKFIFQPVKRLFDEGEPVQFNLETYNDIYERIGDVEVSLNVTDVSGNSNPYTLYSHEIRALSGISQLEDGTYRYRASARIGSSSYSVNGEFLVMAEQLESINLTADHDLLSKISENTGGQYYHFSDYSDFQSDLEQLNLTSQIESHENISPLIRERILLLLIALIFSAEWFLRKFWGSY